MMMIIIFNDEYYDGNDNCDKNDLNMKQFSQLKIV